MQLRVHLRKALIIFFHVWRVYPASDPALV